MNSAIVDIMGKTSHTLPEAHHSAEKMCELAFDVYENTGFENFGVPFCMTVEAEALGSEVDYGTLACEPKVKKEAFSSVKDMRFLPEGAVVKNKRAEGVIQAVCTLSKKYPDIPTIGSITGPISACASIVEPMTFLKELNREKAASHKALEYVTRQIIAYAELLAENGAAAISIADPTATGEILGPKKFDEFAVLYLNKIADAIHKIGIPVIIHICGDVRMLKGDLLKLRGEVLSVDAFVDLKKLKEELSGLRTMGNMSTYLLEFGTPNDVYKNAKHLMGKDIDIMSPACGLSTSTSVENITAFTCAVKEGKDA